MARKIVLYIATSLNSRIATLEGSVEWLESIPNPEKTDYGYKAFYDSIDTTIQGYHTYKQVKSWDIPFPYKGKMNYVFTTKTDLQPDPDVVFVDANHIDFINNMKAEEGKDIWVIGGGQVNTLMLNAGLVDEIILFVMPIILNGGIEMFEGVPNLNRLELISSRAYQSGAIELRYKIKDPS